MGLLSRTRRLFSKLPVSYLEGSVESPSVRRRARLFLEPLEDRTLMSSVPAPALYEPSRIIVRLDPGTRVAQIHNIVPGATFEQELHAIPGARVVNLPAGTSVETAVAQFRQCQFVRYAEPSYYRTLQATIPNDAFFGNLYGMHNTGQSGGTLDADIDAPEAWDLTTGSSSFVVAVFDTGIDFNHPDLAANVWINPGEIAGNSIDDDGNGFVDDIRGWNWFSNNNNVNDLHGHGTHVSGTIGGAGNNSIGVAGVNWNVKIMPMKIFSDGGTYAGDAAVVSAMNYVINKGIKVSNHSWGGGPFSTALRDGIAALRNAGHLFIAAAGNHGGNNDAGPFYPASYGDPTRAGHMLDNVIAVAATTRTDTKASFSAWGLNSVHLGAPGLDTFSTWPTALIASGYNTISGTSMATPHVTGTAALAWAFSPSSNYLEIKNAILAGVDPNNALRTNGPNPVATGGRLNVHKTLLQLNPALTGPRITAQTPTGTVAEPVSSLRVTFNKEITATTFAPSDIVSFTGPAGQISVTNVDPVSGSTTQFDITFPPQTATGVYTLVLGPDIRDTSDNQMDQDNDLVTGEVPADRYTAVFRINLFGPDGFGYRATPTPFQSIDLVPGAAGVVSILDNQDNGATGVNLGSNTFNFYGTTYTGSTQLFASSNGLITFTSGNTSAANTDLTTTPAQRSIAPLWDDWRTNTSANDVVLYQLQDTSGDAIPDRLVIEWNQVPHLSGLVSNPVTFQAILTLNTGPNAGDIVFNYPDIVVGNAGLDNGASATVGIKDTGTQGLNRLLIHFLGGTDPFVQSGRALRIAKDVRILDNGDVGFSTAGVWSAFPGQGYQADVHFSDAGSGADVANWTFTGLTPGLYRVSATWSAHPNRATDAPFTVLDGSIPFANVNINQELGPNDFSEGGFGWEDLGGPYAINGNVLVVRLTDLADEYVIADAIRIERIGDVPVQIIDNGDAGFATTGDWTAFPGQGYQSDVHFSGSGAGADVATWTFTALTPGLYRVSATWSEHPNRATNAPFTVLDGDNPLGAFAINQELIPDDFNDAGAFWENLGGLHAITGSVLAVRLSDLADEYVIADGIRIERVGNLPVQVIDNGDLGFFTTGEWTPFADQGFQSDVHFSASGSGADLATWTFTGLVPGLYRVSVTWPEHPNRATDASFTILDGVNVLGAIPINQELAPDDFSFAGVMWEDLGGPHLLTGNQLVVQLSDLANEYVIADAIRIERIG
jgi:hypothetical protein